MIVLDASAVVDLLLRNDPGPIERIAFAAEASWHAPQLLDIEVASALRRYSRQGEVAAERADLAIADLAELPIHRYEHEAMLPRIWELRHTHTAYDAVYVALAETLEARLVTRDARLASSHGHAAHIVKV